jgi:F0F1-type ATP synthase membrane subunit b/b'
MLMSMSREMATNEDLEKLREVTKEDIEGLRREVKEDMERLREEVKDDVERLREDLKSYVDARMNDLNARMADLYGVVKASLIAIVVTLASTILVPLALRLPP